MNPQPSTEVAGHLTFSPTVALVRATSHTPDTAAIKTTIDVPPAPFSHEFVTITKHEHIELRQATKYWQTLHHKAVTKFDQQEVRHDRLLRELKAQTLKSNAALQGQLDLALAQVCDLQKRLFGGKCEQGRPGALPLLGLCGHVGQSDSLQRLCREATRCMHQLLRMRLKAQGQGDICRLERRAAAKELAVSDQQCALLGDALDRIKRLGPKDSFPGYPSVTRGLETPIWLRARAAGDLRRTRATQGHLLQGRQLNQRRTHHGQGQEIHQPRATTSGQRHRAIPAAQKSFSHFCADSKMGTPNIYAISMVRLV